MPHRGTCYGGGVYLVDNQEALFETLSDGTWTDASAPLPAGAESNSALDAVSCGSTCVAVGSYTDASGVAQPLAETLTAGAWAPSTPSASVLALTGISCASSRCLAVGNDPSEGDSAPTAETLADGDWSETMPPSPDDSSNTLLDGVACYAAASCTAVGLDVVSGNDNPLVENLAGSAWTASSPSSPGGPSTAGTNSGLSGVACTSNTACVAVGSYETTSDGTEPLVETLGSGGWTAGTPTAQNSNPTLYDVSCATTSACAAVGAYVIGTSDSLPMTETLEDGSWIFGNPNLPGGGNTGLLLGVSCSGPATCLAVGVYGNQQQGDFLPLAATLSGDTWTTATPTYPGGVGALLTGVSCPSTTTCVAVGVYYDVSGDYFPFVDTLAGGKWTSTALTAPPGADLPVPAGVSCAAVGRCVAVVDYSDSSGDTHVFADTLADGSCVPTTPALPSGATNPALSGVSCTRSFCTAVGDYYDASDTVRPLAETLIGSAWTPTTPPTPAGVTNAALSGVACDTTCTAVGGGTNAGGSVPIVSTSTAFAGPTVSSVSPRSGIESGGTTVTVTGTNFLDGATVQFGSKLATSVTVNSSTQLTAVSPPGLTGTVNVTVATSAGTSPSSAADTYTYFSPPPGCPTTTGVDLGSAVGVAAVTIRGCPGYFVVDNAGKVSAFGSAAWHGDVSGVRLNAPVISITATPDGMGYWLLGADGGVFTFGDASFYGSTANIKLNAPVVGMAVTTDNRGYWIIAKDGGVFTYGDATFHGSTGNVKLNKPVDGIAVAPGGDGYWLIASDGGVFTFTPDGFYGSLGDTRLNKPIIGMSGTPNGRGYTLVGSDGGVFTFGDAPFYGSLGDDPPTTSVVDLSPAPADNGYYLVDSGGGIYTFGPGATNFGNA